MLEINVDGFCWISARLTQVAQKENCYFNKKCGMDAYLTLRQRCSLALFVYIRSFFHIWKYFDRVVYFLALSNWCVIFCYFVLVLLMILCIYCALRFFLHIIIHIILDTLKCQKSDFLCTWHRILNVINIHIFTSFIFFIMKRVFYCVHVNYICTYRTKVQCFYCRFFMQSFCLFRKNKRNDINSIIGIGWCYYYFLWLI